MRQTTILALFLVALFTVACNRQGVSSIPPTESMVVVTDEMASSTVDVMTSSTPTTTPDVPLRQPVVLGTSTRATNAPLIRTSQVIPVIPTTTHKSVAIIANGVVPVTVEVTVNSRITWNNIDSLSHRLNADPLFDSGPVAPGASFGYTFRERGTYTYQFDAASQSYSIIVK